MDRMQVGTLIECGIPALSCPITTEKLEGGGQLPWDTTSYQSPL